MEFSRRSLEQAGFEGWIPFADLRAAKCPSEGGIYVVTYQGENPSKFAERSCGGWFKGKDPTVPEDQLIANWVQGSEIVYIGQSGDLKRRLKQFADFGAGKPIGHWGGRLIWQLPSVDKLLVAWKPTPGQVPEKVEADLISLFRTQFGKPPFANAPHLLGR
jgi:hypothetical protein